jgi:hypothetical protein
VSQVGLITAVAPFTPFPFVHESKSGLLHTKARLNVNSLEASPTSWRPRLHLLKFREDMKDQPILVCRWQLTLGRVSGVIAGGSYWLTASDCRWSNLSDCFLSATGSQSRDRSQGQRKAAGLANGWNITGGTVIKLQRQLLLAKAHPHCYAVPLVYQS